MKFTKIIKVCPLFSCISPKSLQNLFLIIDKWYKPLSYLTLEQSFSLAYLSFFQFPNIKAIYVEYEEFHIAPPRGESYLFDPSSSGGHSPVQKQQHVSTTENKTKAAATDK